MIALDELDLGAARSKTFVELGAGTGMATVAALAWHGFARALACEGDPDAHRVLELNLTANAVRTQARPARTVPRRIGRDRAGLIWAESGADAEHLLAGGAPVVLRLERTRRSLLAGLSKSHTHFVLVSTARHSRLRPITALRRLSCAARSGHVLAVRFRRPDGPGFRRTNRLPPADVEDRFQIGRNTVEPDLRRLGDALGVAARRRGQRPQRVREHRGGRPVGAVGPDEIGQEGVGALRGLLRVLAAQRPGKRLRMLRRPVGRVDQPAARAAEVGEMGHPLLRLVVALAEER